MIHPIVLRADFLVEEDDSRAPVSHQTCYRAWRYSG